MPKTTSSIRIGIGGWTFAPWRGVFYPDDLTQKRELEYASRKLTSIEVNGTFYGAQKPETFAKWRDEAPDGFVFSLKGPRFATNRRVLAEAGESIERFLASVAPLGETLGAINWQLPPTKKFDPEDMAAFIALLPDALDGRPLRHALEVRHDSFRTPEFIDMARAAGIAIVMAGDSRYPQIADPTAPFVYARIMGTAEGEAAGYSKQALDAWAERARTYAAGGTPADLESVAPPEARPPAARDVYLYVISGHKVANPAAAMALIERLA
ncbi:DUF72 domain-containing protein [Iodidimonas sp. SYSU 1G8]|uniref:DUF72 domain-containing protein n=1 Tax=Iodidimonas sp. SYSU 1G8 TaxID=3133967 RepID=UPI0031FE8ED9